MIYCHITWRVYIYVYIYIYMYIHILCMFKCWRTPLGPIRHPVNRRVRLDSLGLVIRMARIWKKRWRNDVHQSMSCVLIGKSPKLQRARMWLALPNGFYRKGSWRIRQLTFWLDTSAKRFPCDTKAARFSSFLHPHGSAPRNWRE